MAGRKTGVETIEEEYEGSSVASTPRQSNPEPVGSCKRIYSIRNGSGAAIHFAWQSSSGSLLASSIEGSHCVYIYSRQGATVQQLPLKGNCAGLAWDADGDFLAILTEASSVIVLWDSHSRRLLEIESNIKDPGTCLVWSKTSKILAYTTNRGNLLVYNHQTLRKIPIIGKHSKRIVTAAWSNDNCLALATIDNQMSINTIDGDAIKVVHLRAKPSDLKFGHVKEDHSTSTVDNTVSLLVGEKTLYLLKVDDPSGTTSPLELGFQPRYGNIVSHFWHGDGYILCSFSGGFIVMISSHHREIGTELTLTELRNEPLRASSLSQTVSKFAVCYGDRDNVVDIREASDTNKVLTTINMSEAESKMRPAVRCEWSTDGQLLALVTTSGDLHVFLTTVPQVGAATGQYIVQMSSLSDLTIHSFHNDQLSFERTIRLEVEPTLLAASKSHFVVGVNNRVWFYSFTDALNNLSTEPLFIKEYNSNVTHICLNEKYIAVRLGDKLSLHLINSNGLQANDNQLFPEASIRREAKVGSHALLQDFLLYALDNPTLKIFGLEQWAEVATVKIPNGIPLRRVHADSTGFNIVLLDNNGNAYLYDMVNDLLYTILNFPTRHDGLLWDTDKSTSHIFAVHSADSLSVQLFILKKDTISGTCVDTIGSVEAFSSHGVKPYILRKGKIYFQTPVGQIDCTEYIYVDKSQESGGVDLNPAEIKMRKLKTFITFSNFKEAYNYCQNVNDKSLWEYLGKQALANMDLRIAIKAYSALENLGMVMDLKKIQKEDDFKISCGHVALLLSKHDFAQECYITSSDPYSALRMRMALAQWDLAEELAKEFADDYICEVTTKYAIQEESLGDHKHALELFEKAFEYSNSYGVNQPEILALEGGIARNSIRCGQFKRGFDIAMNSESRNLMRDCAEGLENAKCYTEAAVLHEQAKDWDKAASLYIRIKMWDRVRTILPRIKSSRIYLQYARAKEGEHKYLEAAQAYEKAKDIESACRMYTKLKQPDDAIRLVKAHKSLGGALVTAKYFENLCDYDTAIRFLILSNCHDDALGLAFRYGKSDLYVQIVLELFAESEGYEGGKVNINYGEDLPQEYREGVKKVAHYYEDQKDHVRAGKYFLIAGQSRKAFIILLKAASSGVTHDEDTVMALLTDAAAVCNETHFESQFMDICLGLKGGTPKDPKHLLTYCIKVKKYVEAVKTVLVVSYDYLRNAMYKVAHQHLFMICRELKKNNFRIPKDLVEEFTTVHYYVLARLQGSVKNHQVAARLHRRLLVQSHRFPQHAMQIMSQAIIFCQKAGMLRTAMDTCYILMQPENRPGIPPQYKTKFETMVRKHGKSDLSDANDEVTACPFCQCLLPSFDLTCPECRSDIPICIASGRHITANELTACPSCDFPAIRSEILMLLKDSKNPTCPLCDGNIDLRNLVSIADPRPYLFPLELQELDVNLDE